MKLAILSILVLLAVSLQGVHSQNIFQSAWEYARDFAGGVGDMLRAYNDMLEANTIGADKYFHARGNYDAAQRGPGGRDAAEMISNAGEWVQGLTGQHAEDSAEDQKANEYGRNGGDPNHYRPAGLDSKY